MILLNVSSVHKFCSTGVNTSTVFHVCKYARGEKLYIVIRSVVPIYLDYLLYKYKFLIHLLRRHEYLPHFVYSNDLQIENVWQM